MDKISKICGDKPMIIFLSCTSKKKNYKCPAKELYSASPHTILRFKDGGNMYEDLLGRGKRQNADNICTEGGIKI